MKESEESDQKKMIVLLSEIAKWTKFDGMQKARQIFSDNLKKDAEKLAYHYSDGRGSTEIAKLSGVSDFAVRSYWKKWASLDIVVPSEKYKGRYERLFSLEDFGIEVPAQKPPEVKTDSVQNPAEPGKDSGVKSDGEKVEDGKAG
jgi:hypothetical protein